MDLMAYCSSFRANNVEISPEQVKLFINSVDANKNSTIESAEFPDLIFHVRSFAGLQCLRLNMIQALLLILTCAADGDCGLECSKQSTEVKGLAVADIHGYDGI